MDLAALFRTIVIMSGLASALIAQEEPLPQELESIEDIQAPADAEDVDTLETLTQAAPEPASTHEIVVLEGMPCFYQINIEFTANGEYHCAPTAASNALMWLANHGYPKLKPTAPDDETAQKELIKQLAYLMATQTKATNHGTPSDRFEIGIKVYAKEAGYACGSWQRSVRYYSHSFKQPLDINRVRVLSPNTMVWGTVGWYTYDSAKKQYSLEGTHKITIAGYGISKQSNLVDYLIVADPDFKYRCKQVRLKMLQEGTLVGTQAGMKGKTEAKGFYEMMEMDQKWGDWRDRYCILEEIQSATISSP